MENLVIAIIAQTCKDYINGEMEHEEFIRKINKGWASMMAYNTEAIIDFCEKERIKKVGGI